MLLLRDFMPLSGNPIVEKKLNCSRLNYLSTSTLNHLP